MRRFALITLCTLALAGCAQSTPPTGTRAPAAPIPVSTTAGPGAGFMSPFDAGAIFADACLIRGTRFQTATEGLRVYNFTHNTQLGTYYHNTKNLSVKVKGNSCSLVFASNKSVDATVSGLAKGTASITPNLPRNVSITSSVAGDGLRYFRLGIKAPVVLGQTP